MTDEECQDVSDIDPDFDARKVPFAMYYTSGTTGLPKCIVRSHFSYIFIIRKMRYVCFLLFMQVKCVGQLPVVD